MSKGKREDILSSPVALAMVQMVTSRFYDNSTIGLWLFETMGREFDEMSDWASQLHLEIFLQTCTWSVSIWEELMEIEPDDSLTLEVRQQRLLAKALHRAPINPECVRTGVVALTGCEDVVVEDLVAPYTFYVTVNHSENIANMTQVWEYIYLIKPSHLTFRLFFVRETPVEETFVTGGNWATYSEKELPFLETEHSATGHISTGGLGQSIVEITLEEVVAHREISAILGTKSIFQAVEEKEIPEIQTAFVGKEGSVSLGGITVKVEEKHLEEQETPFVSRESEISVGSVSVLRGEMDFEELDQAVVPESGSVSLGGITAKVEEKHLEEQETPFVSRESEISVGSVSVLRGEMDFEEVAHQMAVKENAMNFGGIFGMVEEKVLEDMSEGTSLEENQEIVHEMSGIACQFEEKILEMLAEGEVLDSAGVFLGNEQETATNKENKENEDTEA